MTKNKPIVDDQLVERVAGLCRLNLTAADVHAIKNDFEKILTHFEGLSTLSTQDVSPFFSLTRELPERFPSEFGSEAPTEIHEIGPSLSVQDVLKNAPRAEKNQFVIQAVIEDL